MDRRNAETERDDDYVLGPDEYAEGAMRGHRRDGAGHGPHAAEGRGQHQQAEEDEFAETMFLVALCLMVSGLIWLRGRWVERQRREEEEARRREGAQEQFQGAQGDDGGLFPPRGDPARDDWLILR